MRKLSKQGIIPQSRFGFAVGEAFLAASSATTALQRRRRAPVAPCTLSIKYGLLRDFSLPRMIGCAGPPPLISKHILSIDLMTPTILALNGMLTQTLLLLGANAVPAVLPTVRRLRAVGFGAAVGNPSFGILGGALNRLLRSTYRRLAGVYGTTFGRGGGGGLGRGARRRLFNNEGANSPS